MTTQITALPAPPSRAVPSTFSENMDDFLGAIPAFTTQANSLAIEVNALAAAAGYPNTQALYNAMINSGLLGGFRNKIINGNFSINQRGVSGTVTLAAGAYGHDRWKAGAGGCTYTFATALNITTFTITSGTLVQVIEGVNLQSGIHTLSWSGTAQGRVDSGSYGATGLQGTAVGGTNQSIEFGTGTLSKPQYEPGTVATIFEDRNPGLELFLCQRYARPLVASEATGFTWSTTSAQLISYGPPMRATPALSSISGIQINAIAVTAVTPSAGQRGTVVLACTVAGGFSGTAYIGANLNAVGAGAMLTCEL